MAPDGNHMSDVLQVTDATYRDVVFGSRVPILVAFMDEADSTCRALRPILTELARQRAGHLDVATIDVPDNPALVQAWGIAQLPIMLLFHRGVMQRVLRGVRPLARLVQEIDEMPMASATNKYAALLHRSV
jgi:thioredoxin 1